MKASQNVLGFIFVMVAGSITLVPKNAELRAKIDKYMLGRVYGV